ncbi:MAG: HEAT repeat domain-containing protein [Planctomycetota bacterium]|nr:HEAT repeat domain-containing protein [Planctomycetota bacterium]
MRRARSLLLGLLLGGLALLTAARPAAAQTGHTAGTVEYLARYLVVADDVALVARDAKLSFHPRLAMEAQALLEDGEPDVLQSAVALVALGASGMTAELDRLRSGLASPEPLVRRASVVALGELGPVGAPILIGLLDDEELGHLARLALLRTGAQEGRVTLLERFKSRGEAAVPALIEFVDHPNNFTEIPRDAQVIYDLRFLAARSFGLVDGQRWAVHLTQALAADPAFLDLVVFLAAADTREPAVRDLVLERLVEEGGVPALRAAVRTMMPELRALLANGLYAPADDVEWRVLLEELERRGLEVEDLPLLQAALARPEHELTALRLIVELGESDEATAAAETLRDHLSSDQASVRAAACRGLAATNNAEWTSELERMSDDPSTTVRAMALVGRARLGSGPALSDLRALAQDPTQTPMRTDVVAALFTQTDSPLLIPIFRMARETAIGNERLSIQLALRLNGDLVSGRELVDVLGQPSGVDGRTWLLTSLAANHNRQELPLFEQLFPSERHPAINAPLATALARGGTPEGMQLLRMALWRGPFDRSQLAAAALVKHAGVGVLVAELESAPSGVTSDAFRRVGYSIGMLGGLDALDQLQRRRGPADAALQGAYLGALASRTF